MTFTFYELFEMYDVNSLFQDLSSISRDIFAVCFLAAM